MFIFENLAIISKYLYRLILLRFVFHFFILTAQDPHPAFKQYNVEDGLASSKVYQVKQDSKGYMWFATDNGVSRFNGYEFENFSVNGLPDNTVFEIFEDKKGRVWFLTLTNKLFYYEHNKMHLYKYNNIIDKIEGDRVKTSFCVAENGSVFLGLYTYGIIEITGQGKLKKHIDVNTAKQAVTVIEPVLGSLIYVHTNVGFEKNSIKFDTRFLKGIIKNPTNIFGLQPSARFIRLRNNKILFSYENEMYIFNDLKKWEIKKFDERINWMYEDKDSDLWIGTYLGGVYHIENGDFEHKKNYLKNLFITGITQDNQGGFWFTTEGNSVYYTPSKEILTYDQVSGLKDARVTCLASDTDGIYLGLQHPLIHKITLSGKIESYNCPTINKTVSSVYYDREKQGLWFSGNMLSGFITRDHKISTHRISFIKILKRDDSSYWLVNSNGLYSLLNDNSVSYTSLKIKRMNGLIRKDNETLLIGGIDGLWEYKIAKDTYKHLLSTNPLLHNRILDLVYADNRALFIATKGAGLLILDQDSSVHQITHSNGLSSDNVYKILMDGSVIWLATDKGLTKMTRTAKNSWNIKTYTTHDGLSSNEIYDVHKFNNKIWVATDKGLSFFDPEMSKYNSGELPLYIKQIAVNDSSKPISNYYNLNYFENNIKIKFIALSYKNQGRLQYRYKMSGLKPQWSYTREREIQYTTLPPGNYTFAVSVLNANGTWSREAFVRFKVATPFWKTWWFLTVSVILLILILFFIINYWIAKKHKEKNKEKEINQILLQLKLKALRAQMNPHFIFNVINSIQHFILHDKDKEAHRYLSKFSKLIRAILNNSERNMVPLSEEIKALNLYLELEDMRFEKHFEYEIDVDKTIDSNETQIPSMLIQPYVENAVKHGMSSAKKTGKIRITIVRYNDFLKCTIEDNGVGRAITLKNKSSDYRSFGTSITKERLAVINELYHNQLSEHVIDLYDSHGNASGTRIEIYIPVLK